MDLIVGLGNPGPAYQGTRHNVGFMLVDRLARAQGCRFRQVGLARVCRFQCPEGSLILAKPETYMNSSGRAVLELLERYRLEPSSLLVVFDELALPLGTIRIRARGSAGGHKGMGSILELLGTREIPRLRLGIGPEEAPRDYTDFVLGSFSRTELEVLEEVLERAAGAVEVIVERGLEEAMTRFNREA